MRDFTITTVPLLVKELTHNYPFLAKDFGKSGVLVPVRHRFAPADDGRPAGGLGSSAERAGVLRIITASRAAYRRCERARRVLPPFDVAKG